MFYFTGGTKKFSLLKIAMLKIAWKAYSHSSVAVAAFDYYVVGVNGGVVAFDDGGVVVALTERYCTES